MWKKRENWLFLFAAIGALGALVKILEYCGITLGALSLVFNPPIHGGALFWGLILFAGSIALSAYGIYRSRAAALVPNRVSVTILGQLWAEWAALGDIYERLDFDNRTNDSTRRPFSSDSWPAYGQIWSYTQVELYYYKRFAFHLKKDTDDLLLAFGWANATVTPVMEPRSLMVDLIREIREFQVFLTAKVAEFKPRTS